MHLRSRGLVSSPCKDDNSSVSFSVEVPIPGDGSVLLCHCLQGRHPAPNNNCAKPSNSLPAVHGTGFLKAAAFAPANSGWKAAHTDCRIIIFRWILIFFQQVLHHLTHTCAGSFFFLQVYYACIPEFLRFQPSPLQRSIDTG